MHIFHGFDSLRKFSSPVVTMGSYDGVHAGHRALLARTVEIARSSGGESVVVTFAPHPRVALGRADGLKLLTSTEEKAALLDECGIDCLIIAPFTREFAALPPERFLREYLIDKIGMKTFVVGYDHRFGHDKEGGYDYLEKMRGELGFETVRVSEQDMGDVAVSSTVIRGLIERGDMRRAARMLGKPYSVAGRWDGTLLRSPEPLKLLPPRGEYSVTIETAEGTTAGTAAVTAEGIVISAPAAGIATVRFDG